jgi:acyl-CoA thioester hydrolase
LNSATSQRIFVWPIRVYYEDTDAGGVVYHSRYLHFLERARTECLRELGFEQDILARQEQVLFVVRHVEIDFLKSAHFNAHLTVNSRILQLRRVSLTFDQDIILTADKTRLLHAQVQIACIDTIQHRPCPIPTSLLQKIHHEF